MADSTSPEWIKLYLRNGRTFSYLRRHHPLMGIGFFTELLILLSNTPGHHVNFNDEIDRDYLLDQMNCDEDTARTLLDALVKTEKLDKPLWEVGIVFMPDCIDALTEFYRRKNTKPPTLRRLHAVHLSTDCRQPVDNPRLEREREREKEGTVGNETAISELREAVDLASSGGAGPDKPADEFDDYEPGAASE